jgi:hypothetical protein
MGAAIQGYNVGELYGLPSLPRGIDQFHFVLCHMVLSGSIGDLFPSLLHSVCILSLIIIYSANNPW